MATIIFDENQPEAVNLDKVDVITVSDSNIYFGSRIYSAGRQHYVGHAQWNYETEDEAKNKYSEILNMFGTKITEIKASLDDFMKD